MNFEKKTVLVSGTNRGIGKALVDALLDKKVHKVYATARQVESLPAYTDTRVVPVALDITNPEQVAEVSELANDVDILVNNAGVASANGFLDGSLELVRYDMDTNYYGTLNMLKAFAPVLKERDISAIVNVVTIGAFANLPMLGGYCASKAALFSLSQAMRIELESDNVTVHTVNPGPIDTDMSKGFDGDKQSAAVTADNIIRSVEAGELDIFPDAASQYMIDVWKNNYQDLEKVMADMNAG